MNPDSPNAAGVTVQVRGLRKSYGPQEVLRGLDFEVKAGEVFVLMGPSGSGKTVLLRQVMGLEAPDAGEILIQGEPVHAGEVLNHYRLAMVFQSGALFNSLTVEENVGLYLTEHRIKPPAQVRKIVQEKLALLGLEGAEHKLPGELSGGMKKRVAIARALVIEPQLILYDEPTSELDPLIAVTIGREILTLRQRTGATSLVVTHDRDLAFGIADRLALMHQGRILCLGTAQEVLHHPDPLTQQFLNADFSLNHKGAP
jgi:phospholipid/cholesterol/gamma-HCH transport system ATP-binding protein